MTATKKTEEKSTDEIQNGGKKTIEERVSDLEAKLENVIRRNHLLEVDR
jgi:hypothetical protein